MMVIAITRVVAGITTIMIRAIRMMAITIVVVMRIYIYTYIHIYVYICIHTYRLDVIVPTKEASRANWRLCQEMQALRKGSGLDQKFRGLSG